MNLRLFGDKLRRYRNQFEISLDDLSSRTGLDKDLLSSLEDARQGPSGDQLLILADFFKCDYQDLISDDETTRLDRTDTLFRRFGDQFGKQDRWSVQEFLYLCESESFLQRTLVGEGVRSFTFQKTGEYFKGHAETAALELRTFLEYPEHAVPRDVYADFRSIGMHIFRRRLENSNISGLYINHPIAGDCLLVNHSEDVYRQRFTVTHEAAHAIFDRDTQVVVSLWDAKDLTEIRANTFASRFLMPPAFLGRIPQPRIWDERKLVKWANELRVNTEPLLIALHDAGLIDHATQSRLRTVRVPMADKSDPELPSSLAPRSHERKKTLLERGLSGFYVARCFEAYHRDLVTESRLIELLLLESDQELLQLAELYNQRIGNGS